MRLEDGRLPATLLALSILGACLVADTKLPNSHLTLPLLVSALVSAAVAEITRPLCRASRVVVCVVEGVIQLVVV